MEQVRDEQVIFLKDLLFSALYQWRKILIAMVIAALLFCGVGVAIGFQKSANTNSSPVANANESYNEREALLSAQIQQTQALISGQKTYLSESPFMALNPYSFYEGVLSLSVKTDYEILPGMAYQNPDSINGILQAYAVCVNSASVLDPLAEATGISTKYLSELITVQDGGDTSRILTITVVGSDEDTVKSILSKLSDSVAVSTSGIQKTVGDHSIETIISSVRERTDLTVLNKQNTAYDRLASLTTLLTSLQKDHAALVDSSASTALSAKRIITLAVIGAILGAAMIVLFVWIGYISGTTVYSARTLHNRTGIKMLACIPAAGKTSPVDNWLKKLEGRAIDDAHIALAAAIIRNYCSSEHKLLIAVSNPDSSHTIIQELTTAGVQFTVCGSLLQDLSALDALPNSDAVLLIEQCGLSKHADVERSMTMISDQGKKLVGCVLLGG